MAISREIQKSISGGAWIREMFDLANELKAKLGEEEIFDFSIGNPIVEPPREFFDSLGVLLKQQTEGYHRYMANAGIKETREHVASELRTELGIEFDQSNIVMCVGAGGGLNVVLKSLLDPGDEVIIMAPFFPDYGSYIQNHGGICKVANTDTCFQIDLTTVDAQMSEKTKIILINSPNNPTGVVYSQEMIDSLGLYIREKENEYGHEIYLLSDEPYRKIIYEGIGNGNIFKSHINSILVSSHSKDLALAGERIGYIALNPRLSNRQLLENALAVSTRILGFVNAPALMQRVLPLLGNITVSVADYQRKRDRFTSALKAMGYKFPHPQGAFYLFPQSPIDDEIEFIRTAREERLFLVPGTGFGRPGHFRISYCTSDTILERSLPHFEKLALRYGLKASSQR